MELPRVNPFHTCSCCEPAITALDDTPVTPLGGIANLKKIYFAGEDCDDWDGNCAAIFELNDGRFCAYESWWGPTGDGFYCDAYGGGGQVFVAKSLREAAYGLTQKGKELCGFVGGDAK